MLNNLVDTIFSPVIRFLAGIALHIRELSVPLSRPLDFGKYLGWFGFLGSYWMTFVTTVMALGFIYLVLFFIVSNIGLFRKFKDFIQWW